MKAIETTYNGYLFRSRTEARWGVFFHEAGIDHEYEPEGFELGDSYYLPDFWLPEISWWVEVKPAVPSSREKELARLLMLESGCDTYIFCGSPANSENGGFAVWGFPALGEARQNVPGQLVLQEMAMNTACSRFRQGPIDGFNEVTLGWALIGRIQYALDAARKARFEHGQRGGPTEWEGYDNV